MDTMTATKVVAGVCSTALVFLLGKWAAEVIYHPAADHGDEAHSSGFVIEVAEAEVETEAAVEVSFAELYAAADVGKGEGVFKKCRACHKVENGANGTGPHLFGVVNRSVDGVVGFSYSGALSAVADQWTPENLYAFLTKPSDYAPGTSMGFAGLKKSSDRVNLIAYLETIK